MHQERKKPQEEKSKTADTGVRYRYPVKTVKLDFQTTPDKSLTKPPTLFRHTDNIRGIYVGRHSKKSQKGGKEKTFYLGTHNLNAYFAYQILLRLGINAPKARLVQGIDSSAQKDAKTRMATKDVATEDSEFIDLLAVLHDVDLESRLEYRDEEIHHTRALRKRYKLDPDTQLMTDLSTGRQHKIDDAAFGAFVVAILLNDEDFISETYGNFGFVKVGDRFIPTAIDKECAKFDGESYSAHKPNCKLAIKTNFFRSPTPYPDQQLALIHETEAALAITENKQCDFDRIFCNSRVMATPELKGESRSKCENFKKTAQSMVDEYKDELVLFRQREVLRKQIAAAVVKAMRVAMDIENPGDLEKAVVKDLRGPYYRQYFDPNKISEKDVGNRDLIMALVRDFTKQLAVVAKKDEPVATARPGIAKS